MTISAMLDSFRFFIYLALLWVGFFWLYRNHALDSFRQNMFALRDQLFDEAADGLIPFNHPAYGILRGTMNGFIRFGHRLSFLDMIISYRMIPKKEYRLLHKYSFDEKYAYFTSELKPDAKERLDYFRNQMMLLAIKHMMKTSLFSILFIFLLFIPMIIYQLVKKPVIETFKSIFRAPLNGVESTAMALGSVS